jgi:hypothetical protein
MRTTNPQPALELTGDFHVEPGYKNPYGRVTNWKLKDRKGNRLATMTTKQDAVRIADILTKAYAILQRERQTDGA